MWKKVKFRLAVSLTSVLVLLLRILGRTIRWRTRYEFEKDRGKIYALWHGHALALTLYGMDRGIYTIASRSRDGELAARIGEGLGYRVVRGSTEEGRVEKGGRRALIQLIRALREGHNVAITVDGPKGPPFRVQKGVVFLAQKSGAPIVPAVVRLESYKSLKTWDRMLIPLPFTRGEVLRGEELIVREGDDLEEKRLELERALLELSSSPLEDRRGQLPWELPRT